LTTSWRPLDESTRVWPAVFAAIRSSRTPDAAVRPILRALRADSDSPREGITARTVERQGDTASILVFERGLADDSTTGVDVRLGVTAGTNGVVILKAETRQICARAVTADRLACV